MSLGFGKVAVGDWDSLKKGGFGGDQVEPGEYALKLEPEVRHLEPSEKSKGQGVYFVRMEVIEPSEKFVGKKVERGLRYHPNPPNEKLEKMNNITAQKIAQIAEATNTAPVIGSDLQVDLVATLKAACVAQGRLRATVSHSVTNGVTYQEVEGFAPLV